MDNVDEFRLEKHSGFVAFFDILGYQSFLQAKNSPEDAVKRVLSAIVNAKQEVPKHAIEKFKLDESDLADVRWLVFSDTILIAVTVKDGEDDDMKQFKFILLIALCGVLQRYMFDFGLPVRGAITEGDFFLTSKEACFAGLPIIAAYELCSKLDLAACVIETEVARKYIKHDWETPINYRIPLKGGGEADYYTVTPIMHHPDGSWKGKDIRQLVAESFWDHGKQISRPAQIKLENTELLFRRFKLLFKDRFA